MTRSDCLNRFFECIDTLHQLTLSLDAHPERFRCRQCHQSDQFVSHGFVYKKQQHGEKRTVGKRLFCANRHARSGCGATLRLSLADTLPRRQRTASQLQCFVLALLAGTSIVGAYQHATGTQEARHAYRWLHRFQARLVAWRAFLGRQTASHAAPFAGRCRRLRVLLPTLAMLHACFGAPFVTSYQSCCQQPFLG